MSFQLKNVSVNEAVSQILNVFVLIIHFVSKAQMDHSKYASAVTDTVRANKKKKFRWQMHEKSYKAPVCADIQSVLWPLSLDIMVSMSQWSPPADQQGSSPACVRCWPSGSRLSHLLSSPQSETQRCSSVVRTNFHMLSKGSLNIYASTMHCVYKLMKRVYTNVSR